MADAERIPRLRQSIELRTCRSDGVFSNKSDPRGGGDIVYGTRESNVKRPGGGEEWELFTGEHKLVIGIWLGGVSKSIGVASADRVLARVDSEPTNSTATIYVIVTRNAEAFSPRSRGRLKFDFRNRSFALRVRCCTIFAAAYIKSRYLFVYVYACNSWTKQLFLRPTNGRVRRRVIFERVTHIIPLIPTRFVTRSSFNRFDRKRLFR